MNKKIFIVTVKLPRNPKHDPRHKKTGRCKFSSFCTDVTGEHHNFLVVATGPIEVAAQVLETYGNIHITRIEVAEWV